MSGKSNNLVLEHLKLVLTHLQTVQNQLDDVNRRFSAVDQEFDSQTRLITNMAEGQSQTSARMRKFEARLEQSEQSGADRHATTLDDHAIRPEHFNNARPLPHQRTTNGEHHRPAHHSNGLNNVYGFNPRQR